MESSSLKILIFTPVPRGSTKGNRITAIRWSQLLRALGHKVTITDKYDSTQSNHQADCLISLHAYRSARAIAEFRKRFPDRPIFLCLTGTDVHRDLQGERGAKNKTLALRSLELADQIILLEPECRKRLPAKAKRKTCVIFQSAKTLKRKPTPLKNSFEVSVLGHLRYEKDPMLTAIAARDLPESSRIQIKHLGGAYTAAFISKANSESRTNPRYRWLKERPHGEAMRLLSRSRLTVLTSRTEGAPSLFSESVMNQVPILATRIDASIGLLGRDYPGLFDVGEVERLTELLHKSESDEKFYLRLMKATRKLRPRFGQATEQAAWKKLLKQFS